ncbi:MAG: hypothetical protein IH591_11270, partial [Bacteroidales bacterium]|nr:hypothetical protein [Bacteroidales bacterium]
TAVAAFGQPDKRIAKIPAVNYDWQAGYVNTTEFTGGPGLSATTYPYSRYYYGITNVNGYQFTRNMKAGIGLGIHKHNEGTLFPAYLDARYSFNAQRLVPFVAAAGGLALNFNNIGNGTWLYINPSAGIRYVAATRTSVTFSAGLMSMAGEGTRHSFLSFKLGMELKSRQSPGN